MYHAPKLFFLCHVNLYVLIIIIITLYLHTIFWKTLAAKLVKRLVTAEKSRSFSSVLMWSCSMSYLLDTAIQTSSHSTFAFDFFSLFLTPGPILPGLKYNNNNNNNSNSDNSNNDINHKNISNSYNNNRNNNILIFLSRR